MNRQYRDLGLGLVAVGLGLVPTAFLLLNSIPIIALGIAVIILGAVCLALARTRPKISPEVSSLLMKTGVENIGSLLEELGLKSRGMYLPSSLAGGKPRAIIPLHKNPHFPNINVPLNQRLIVSCGQDPEDIGIMVTTAGSNIINMLETKPGATSDEVAAALSTVLIGALDLATGVEVTMENSKVIVRLSNPRLEEKENTWVVQSLGSSTASIVASLLAEALGKPVIIESESLKSKENLITLEIISTKSEIAENIKQ